MQIDSEASVLQSHPPEAAQLFKPKWQNDTGQYLFCEGCSPAMAHWGLQGTWNRSGISRLALWCSLKDGVLGTILSVITMDPSSTDVDVSPPQMAQWATGITAVRWSEHRKKMSGMALGNCSEQTGLRHPPWGIPQITEWDLNGGAQGSEMWRCKIDSAQCELFPSMGPHCNPQAREIWGHLNSWR